MRLAFKTITAIFLALGGVQSAVAQSVVIGSTEFGTLDAAISALGTETYTALNPAYTETRGARFTFGAPSETITLAYRARSTEVEVRAEDGTVLASFEGATRSASEVDLMVFLRERYARDPGTRLLIVANTPDDPVAGSPVSLQSMMVNATFSSSTDVGPSPNRGGSRARGTLSYNHLGISLQSGRYTGPGFSANVTSLPISFSIPLDDPRWAIKLDAPLNFTTVNGQDFVSGSIGVGLRMPVTDNWTITPELRIGAVRNSALDVTTMLANASISSNYHIDLRNGFGLTFGNSLTYSKSLSSGGIDYGLKNVINKNGFEVSGPMEFQLYGLPTNWEFSLVHTKIDGTAVFINEWVDMAFSLGTIGSKNNVTWDSVRMGVTLTKANRGVRGINFNFGYEF